MQDFVNKVFIIGKSMGYSNSYMEVFLLDIEICYYEGMTPEQCFEKVF